MSNPLANLLGAYNKQPQQTQAVSKPTSSSLDQDLTPLIKTTSADCLNQHAKHNLHQLLLNSTKTSYTHDSMFLESKTDPELIIHLPFSCPVHIRSLQLVCNDNDSKPQVVKLYVNRPTLSFHDVDSTTATETITVGDLDKHGISTHNVKFVKFRNVQNLTLFVESNYGAPSTIIKALKIFGQSEQKTDMNELKACKS